MILNIIITRYFRIIVILQLLNVYGVMVVYMYYVGI